MQKLISQNLNLLNSASLRNGMPELLRLVSTYFDFLPDDLQDTYQAVKRAVYQRVSGPLPTDATGVFPDTSVYSDCFYHFVAIPFTDDWSVNERYLLQDLVLHPTRSESWMHLSRVFAEKLQHILDNGVGIAKCMRAACFRNSVVVILTQRLQYQPMNGVCWHSVPSIVRIEQLRPAFWTRTCGRIKGNGT